MQALWPRQPHQTWRLHLSECREASLLTAGQRPLAKPSWSSGASVNHQRKKAQHETSAAIRTATVQAAKWAFWVALFNVLAFAGNNASASAQKGNTLRLKRLTHQMHESAGFILVLQTTGADAVLKT